MALEGITDNALGWLVGFNSGCAHLIGVITILRATDLYAGPGGKKGKNLNQWGKMGCKPHNVHVVGCIITPAFANAHRAYMESCSMFVIV